MAFVSPTPKSQSRRSENTGTNTPNRLSRSIAAVAMPGSHTLELLHATAKQTDRGSFPSFNLSASTPIRDPQHTMKITHLKRLTLACLPLAISPLVSSCGAPDPRLQKEMDQDILTAAERKGPGDTTGAQQGQGSRNYGHGGF